METPTSIVADLASCATHHPAHPSSPGNPPRAQPLELAQAPPLPLPL